MRSPRPYRWRVLAGSLLFDMGDGERRDVSYLIDHDRRTITLAGRLSAVRRLEVATIALLDIPGRPVAALPDRWVLAAYHWVDQAAARRPPRARAKKGGRHAQH